MSDTLVPHLMNTLAEHAKKPEKMHLIRREGARYVFLNQAGQEVELPGNVTIAQLLAQGIVVRLHRAQGVIEPDVFLARLAPF